MITLDKAMKTKKIEHFIDGEFRQSKSKETFVTTNPATQEDLAAVACGNAEDINDAVSAARRSFEHGPWARLSVRERSAVLKKIGDLILENKEKLARAETLDTGKPISETMEGDIPRAAYNFHFFAEYAASQNDQVFTVNSNERHLAVREPLGVCGLITPWNLPLYLSTWKLAPCLAMGNSCVLKPAEWTPYTAFLFAELANQAGLPKGVLNIVQGFGAKGAGEALTRHPDVNSISFTGETTTGKAIMQASSDSLKKLSFELGGKGANIIFADADLNEALPTAIRAAFRNQGQICLAGSRLFVQEEIAKKVIADLTERVKAIRVGDPLDDKTQMGALISREHLEKVQSYIELGKKTGKLITGGERLTSLGEGNFLSPALFTDLPYDSRFCQEEIFGPVLPIITFKDEEEAINMANSTIYGLSASLWSSDVNRCHRVSSRLHMGNVWVNCWFARDLRAPFGGQKSSGVGREGGRYSLEFFSEAKTITYKYS